MIRISDAKLDHLMDVAELSFDKAVEARTTHAELSLAASNLIIAELLMRQRIVL